VVAVVTSQGLQLQQAAGQARNVVLNTLLCCRHCRRPQPDRSTTPAATAHPASSTWFSAMELLSPTVMAVTRINYHHNLSQPVDQPGKYSCHLAATWHVHPFPVFTCDSRMQQPAWSPLCPRHEPVANRHGRQPSVNHQPSTIPTRSLVTKLAPTPATWQPRATCIPSLSSPTSVVTIEPPSPSRHQSVTNHRQPSPADMAVSRLSTINHNHSQPGDQAGTNSCPLAATCHVHPFPVFTNKRHDHCATITNPSPTRH
jgi:hypothetical protein